MLSIILCALENENDYAECYASILYVDLGFVLRVAFNLSSLGLGFRVHLVGC